MTQTFTDPDEYKKAIRAGDGTFNVLERGSFQGELTQISVGRIMVRRGRETLARVATSWTPPGKVGLLGWFGDGPFPLIRGLQPVKGELFCLGRGLETIHRTFGRNDFFSLLFDEADLAEGAEVFPGRELRLQPGAVLRPPAHLYSWLVSAVGCALHLAEGSPDLLNSPQAARTLEHALLEPAVLCLTGGEPGREPNFRTRHADIVLAFTEIMDRNLDGDLLLPDLCRLIGVPGRTLRRACEEQLGISPKRFLGLRRMQLARQALLRSVPGTVTVTEVATRYGLWELGRFAVSYKSLFGESPSATLIRPGDKSQPVMPDIAAVLAGNA